MEIIIKCSDDVRGGTNIYGEPIKELVRCKECKRTKDYFKQHTDRLVWCEKWECAMDTNGYCSYGERKDHE